MEGLLPLLDPHRRLRLYLETADVVLLLLDRDGCVREINRRACELLGFAERDLVGRDWFASCVPAAVRDELRAAFNRLMDGEMELLSRHESPLVTREGKIRRIAWHHALVRDAAGVPLGTLSSGEEVSDARATAALLQRLAAGTASEVGEGFLRRLVRELVSALEARCALIGEPDDGGERLRVLAAWPPDPFFTSFELPLDGSALLPQLGSDLRLLPAEAARRFPSDPLLARYQTEALLALSLQGPERQLGVLAVLYDRPEEHQPLTEAVFRLFGSRAAAELERLRTERALHTAKELAEVTLQSIGDAVITTDPQGWVTSLNPAAERFLGWPRQEALGLAASSILRLVDERTREPLPDPIEQCFREGGPVTLPVHTLLLARDGSERAVADTAAPIRDACGNVVGSVLVFQDVTEARQLAHTLAYRAAHDPLTGLPNRGELERQLENAREDAARRDVEHVLCYLDLDQFKLVNDLCGHQAGDELLRRLAPLLRRRVRGNDMLARLGGDEFGVLLEGCTLERAVEIAESLCRCVRELRFTWEGRVFELGASVGVVPVTADAESSAWLLARADLACYAAKDLGRNRVFVDRAGDPELGRRQRELAHLSDLLAGLERGRFNLAYQPIVPVVRERGRAAGGALRGEVLLRWLDEAGQPIPAERFIPAAERYQLMATVDDWVLREALRYFGERWRAGRLVGEVGLNLSSNTLSTYDFVDRVTAVLDDTGFPAERVCFEITETAAINNLDQAVELMGRLRARGCRFALDDFGSGLSSFSLLRSLPIDVLKIDGSFVRNMRRDPVDRAVVEATARVAHAMGVTTVAEWVEERALLPLLGELGIDYAQGYACGRPRPLGRVRWPVREDAAGRWGRRGGAAAGGNGSGRRGARLSG